MAKFVPKIYEDILQRLINRVVARTTLTDLTDTSNAKTVLAAVAREIDDVYFAITNLLSTFSIDSAAGSDLDERALDFNLTRNAAIAANGSLVFSRTGTSGLLSIPAGTRISVPGSSPEVVAVTTASGSIANLSSTSAPVAAVMEKPGVTGNVSLNTLTAFKGAKPTGVDAVTNPNPFAGGQDVETDDAFRARIKAFIATLPRTTVDALTKIASSVKIASGQRVVFASVVEDPILLGRVYVYIDDGAGTAESTTNNYGSAELLTTGPNFPGNVAQGGEQILDSTRFPVKETESIILIKNPGAVTLVQGTDFNINPASARVFLFNPLTAGDSVTLQDTVYTGLVKQVQKVIDGDPNDRVNFPGWRAAGVLVAVRVPTIIDVVVEGNIVVLDGFDRAAVSSLVASAIASYINGIGIGGDVVVSEIVKRAKEVAGVYDFTLTTPTTNIPVLSDQLPRTNANTDIAIV